MLPSLPRPAPPSAYFTVLRAFGARNVLRQNANDASQWSTHIVTHPMGALNLVQEYKHFCKRLPCLGRHRRQFSALWVWTSLQHTVPPQQHGPRIRCLTACHMCTPSSASGPGPPNTSEYYPRGGRPGADYPPSARLSPLPSGPPPSSASSSFYDRSAGPPPTTGSSTVTGGGEREYRRDRADEYAAPPPSAGAAISYERPRSPAGGGPGRAPMQSYGGRGGYSRPSDPRDRGYMPPPPSRP